MGLPRYLVVVLPPSPFTLADGLRMCLPLLVPTVPFHAVGHVVTALIVDVAPASVGHVLYLLSWPWLPSCEQL
jgi:hypothetical protein